jgi:hypothetical protein
VIVSLTAAQQLSATSEPHLFNDVCCVVSTSTVQQATLDALQGLTNTPSTT